MRDLATGTKVGPYTIQSVAGRGAVGIVYLAEDAGGREVALKTLNPNYAQEGIFRERFSREAQGGAGVQHPNIISILDAGEHQGLPYLVMTYVSGPDLERVLEDRGGRLQAAEAILICSAVADALDEASSQGLAHRDVKPANILLEGWEPETDGGRRGRPHVYLTDFGLIKSSAQVTVTQTGTFVGTLLYMSPEQIESKAVPSSDQYSLACVLWECLTGTFPFVPTGGSMLSLLSAHLNDPVPRISERPGGHWSPDLDTVFFTALAKKPHQRFPTCGAFLDAATRALELGTSAPRSTPAPPLAALPETDQPRSATPAASSQQPGSGRPAAPPPPLAGATPLSAAPPPPLADAVAVDEGVAPAATSPPSTRSGQGTGAPPNLPPGFSATGFPSGMADGRPAGLPASRSSPQASGRRGTLIAAVVLVVLIVAAIIGVVVFAGNSSADSPTPEAQAEQGT
ncbi:MAG: protein kinase domain-containing protein [Euzebya sp.]